MTRCWCDSPSVITGAWSSAMGGADESIIELEDR